MSWANYYRVRLPERVSARDALAAARHVVATCAVPPVDLEARWTVTEPRGLAALAARLQAIAAPAERRVEFELLQADLPALIDLHRRCPHPVELAVGGVEPTPLLFMTLTLERAEGAAEFAADIEIHVQGERDLASEEVRLAVVDRLGECRRAGVLPVAAAPERIVARFLAEARREDRIQRLARGVAEEGTLLVCRSWRGSEPRVLTVVPDRSLTPDPACLAGLWRDDLLSVRGRTRGVGCIATAAHMVRLGEQAPGSDFAPIIDLAVEVHGAPELDAMVDAAGEDPIVVAWWCGFDGWGRAYHGVRLALHGRYQDGNASPDPGRHELIVLVDAKRRSPGAHEVAAMLAARAGLALEYARTGL